MTSLPTLFFLAGLSALPAERPLVVDRAELAMASSAGPPGAEGDWTAVALPDRWRQRRPAAGGTGWYRFSIDARSFPQERWAIYLPSVNMNAAVFLNGQLLGAEGAMTGDLANNWNRPLYFPFLRSSLRPGANEFVVQVEARAHAFGGLGPLTVGPADLLAPRYERQRFLAVSLSQLGTFMALWLFLWASAMWLGTGREAQYGWFALSVLTHALATLNFHVRDLPLPRPAWEWLMNLAPDVCAVTTLLFLGRLFQRSRPRLERSLAVALLLVAGLLAVVPQSWFYRVAHLGHLIAVIAVVLAVFTVTAGIRQGSRQELLIVVAGTVPGAAMVVHDFVVQVGLVDHAAARLVPHTISLYLLAFGSVLVARSVRAFRSCKQHNVELTRAVQERESELTHQFELLSCYQREQVLGQERARIMAEVHDGLGGQLASTVAMAQGPGFCREAVVESLRLIAEELGLLVDALDPTLDDLGSLLAVLRERIEPRAVRAGVRFEWQVSDAPLDRGLRPEELHHVIRIVQEATANVIKHARAQTITVRTAHDAGGVLLEICDDGVGLKAPRRRGRGLLSMQHRARQLGGQLTVEPGNPGTAVRLRLPTRVAAAGDGSGQRAPGSAHSSRTAIPLVTAS